MTRWHPLDAGMTAADEHYAERPAQVQECHFCGETANDTELRIVPRMYGKPDVTCRKCFETADGENSFTDLEEA